MKKKRQQAIAHLLVVTFMTCNRKQTRFIWINEDWMKYERCMQQKEAKNDVFFIAINQTRIEG
jgi:hypothetical protein